jgi:uncharacterized protein (DUF342 family)
MPLEVEISPDKMVATLTLRRSDPVEMQSDAAAQQAFFEAGVPPTDALCEQIGHAVQQLAQGQSEAQVRLEAVGPEDGQPGRVEWAKGLSPEAQERGAADTDDEDGDVDYYEMSHFPTVSAGQQVARVFEPTAGKAGTNVLGEPVDPTPGEPAELKFSDDLQLEQDGGLLAKVAGLLTHGPDQLAINPTLQIDGVGFHTGHIHFDGPVTVNGPVRDNFRLCATGKLQVTGFVEAAHVVCQGDVELHGGMCGKQRGSIEVARDLEARYLEALDAWVGQDLRVQKDMLNTNLNIRGVLRAPSGSLIGGQTHVLGSVQLHALGNPAGAATVIHLGSDGAYDSLADEVEEAIDTLQAQADDIESRQHLLKSASGSPQVREQLEAATARLDELRTHLSKLTTSRDKLQDCYTQRREIKLVVSQQIYPGVTIHSLGQRCRVKVPIRGPLEVCQHKTRTMMIKVGGEDAQPLADYLRLAGPGRQAA